MEPIGHEGLGRLLKLEEDLQTPHVVFSHLDLEESSDLESGGTIKIGKKFHLPPSPLGLDSNKSPYLQLSEDIAVIDNAYSIQPKKLVQIASDFRLEAGYSRLLYAPAVEPSQMPILAYLGVDVFDDLNVELRSSTGWVLDSGEWIKQKEKIDDLFSHNQAELSRWILKIRNAIANGKLRELVEITSLHNPRVSQILYHSASLLIDKGARVHSTIRSNDLSLNHPAILDFQSRLSDYEPPAKEMVLLILPCSARKPYFKSSSHKRFFNTLRELDNHLAFHVVSVTSPLGLVPRELEFCYPAAHYDIAVTGNWNASEVEMLRTQLAKLNPKQHYAKAIVHAGSSSEIMTDLVKELGIDVVNTRVERPSSFEGLEILQNIARMTLSDIPLLNTKDRAKGEAKGLAQFQYGKNADFLVNSEISGRMPYKLRCEDLAAMSPVVGGFGLTLKGGIEYSLQGGPVIIAEDFKLIGDLFAVGVKSYTGNWNIGDQVVIKQNDDVTGVGIAKMAPEEMIAMNRGIAVEVRHHA